MTYKEEFIRFMNESGALQFGSFTLKSGRQAPYFINTGNYNTGARLARLGRFYAECIAEHGIEGDILFGPAYKGIPLAVSTAAALYARCGTDMPFCFDRKEIKDHGEGGLFVGAQPKDGDRVIIIEDVITSGKALREALPKLYKAAPRIRSAVMIITVDRMEKGRGEISAVQEVQNELGIRVYPIVTINDIISAVETGIIEGAEYLPAIKEYRDRYGVETT